MKKYRFDSPSEKFVLSWNGDEKSEIYILTGSEKVKYADRYATYSYSGNLLSIEVDEIMCFASQFEVEANVEQLYISTHLLEVSQTDKFIQKVGKLRSQMTLNHPRYLDLCSPTSCANMIQHLTGKFVDLQLLAEECYDREHDIFGNWAQCVAATYPYIKEHFSCRVVKFQGWESLIKVLEEGGGVILSVKGDLKGAAKSYDQGHLMMIYGIDLREAIVFVADPALIETTTCYSLKEMTPMVQITYIFS